VGSGRIERTVPFLFSMSGETLDIGVDTGSPVGPYPGHFPFNGTVRRIEINLWPSPDDAPRAEIEDTQLRAALGAQ